MQSGLGDETMTDQKDTSDIIDIEPEDVIEHKAGEPTSPQAAKPQRAALRVGLGAALVLAGAVGGGWFYRDVLSSYLPSDQVQTVALRVEALEATSAALNGKLDAVVGLTDEIKSQLAVAQSAAQNADTLANSVKTESANTKNNLVALQTALAKANESIDELKARIASSTSSSSGSETAAAIDTTGLDARITTLEKDVASLKQSGGVASADTSVLSQSLADLKAKIAAGTPYPDELERIKSMVPAAEGLDVLATIAAQGLPNAKGLAAELKTIAAALPAPVAEPIAKDDSWWGSATEMMSGLVTIKPAGVADWQQLANQCVELAEQGDLAKAVTTLEQVEGALPLELQKWHDRASGRLALEQALEKTSDAVLRQIAAKG
jgi:hypothetical protein